MAACRPWLQAEVGAIEPELIVCLGATAAQQVVDKTIRVTQTRGTTVTSAFGTPALITVHPSSLLRRAGGGDLEQEFAAFVADLKKIGQR